MDMMGMSKKIDADTSKTINSYIVSTPQENLVKRLSIDK